MEINSIIVTLSIMFLTNFFGLVYSYLITSKEFLISLKLQSRSYKENILKKRLPLILFNLFTLILVTGLGLYFFSNYIIRDFISINWLFLEVIVVLFVDDIYFYFFHRFMHENRYVYKKIHSIHHRATTPFPSEYLYTHPLEWMGGMPGPFIGMLLLGGISTYSFWALLVIRNLHELDIHSGIKSNIIVKFLPFLGTNEHHDLHHSKFDGNYASTFIFLDKIFKTKIKSKPRFYNY